MVGATGSVFVGISNYQTKNEDEERTEPAREENREKRASKRRRQGEW